MGQARSSRTLVERFLEKFVVRDDGCWEWTASRDKDGYGKFSVARGQWAKAHRVAWMLYVGDLPTEGEPDHTCNRPWCVNPKHLEWVTHQENQQRSWDRRGRPTHCRRGHEMTPENTYVRKNGSRRCRQCRRNRDKTT